MVEYSDHLSLLISSNCRNIVEFSLMACEHVT